MHGINMDISFHIKTKPGVSPGVSSICMMKANF